MDFYRMFAPNNSMVFSQCYFAPLSLLPIVDFSGTTLRNTMFEGGTSEYLRGLQKGWKVTMKDVLDKRQINTCPNWLSGVSVQVHTRVFADVSEVSKIIKVRWLGLTPASAKNLSFNLVYLGGSIFDGLTLSHIELNAPKWLKGVKGRNSLYEEQLIEDNPNAEPTVRKEDLRKLENQYTQLKNNLEKQGNYLHAGDFHFGEQEIRREIGGRRLLDWIMSALYLTFTGYGERPEKALVWLLLLLFLWPFYVLYNDGKWFAMEFRDVYFQDFLQLITPFSWKEIKEVAGNKLHTSLTIFGQILLYIQLPMFLMAVRRRFKR